MRMDYHTIHGQDVSNFSSSSPHRMPTVSAAQALLDLKSSPTRYISTGVSSLDQALQNRDADNVLPGGVSRGKLSEIYGPPGVGKTALGMQLAASALQAGEGVVWVDSAYPLPGPRFSQILASSKSPSSAKPVSDLLLNFTHFFTPSFAHLLALFSRTTTAFPSSSTSLIVIDSLSTLISSAFPRSADSSSTPKKPGVVNPSARKFPLMQYLLTSISKLATTRNIAIVLLSPCVTKMQPGLGATLVPAINTTAWDQGLGCRVALFRDWDWETEMDEEGQGFLEVRFAEILKAEGTTAPSGRGRIAAFGISGDGIHPVTLPAYSPAKTPLPLPRNPITSTPSLPRKRKLSATDLEIPDSEGEDDEDYGWGEEDEEAMPGMPPQWQGSEDILIAPVVELEEEEEEDGQEDEEVTLPRLPEREIEDSEDELGISQ